MSVKADGPAEEEENSGLHYSDEDDDLGAFSDADIGCEDGGRTTAEGHKRQQRREAANCRNTFMAAKIVCGEASASSGWEDYRELSLRPQLAWFVRRTKLQFYAENKHVKCWRAGAPTASTGFGF